MMVSRMCEGSYRCTGTLTPVTLHAKVGTCLIFDVTAIFELSNGGKPKNNQTSRRNFDIRGTVNNTNLYFQKMNRSKKVIFGCSGTLKFN